MMIWTVKGKRIENGTKSQDTFGNIQVNSDSVNMY